MPLDQVIIISLGVLVVILTIWLLRVEIRFRKLLKGSGTNLDESIDWLHNELETLKKFRKQAERTFENNDTRLKKAVTGFEVVRFNPFAGTGQGGNQSFAIALLNENQKGVVISSLYSRDRVSIFSKPIVEKGSAFELSEEEIQAIEKAHDAIVN